MKKILFVAAIAALSFTSCNKDDDDKSSADCFECTVSVNDQSTTSKYCHEGDDNTYSVTVAGVDLPDQTLPEGTTWDEYKALMTESEDCN